MTLKQITLLDQALSNAQQSLGTNLSTDERARFPERHARLSALWDAIEAERRALRRDRDRRRYDHEHHSHDARIVGQAWGTRTIETCHCGAYRTFDVPRGDAPANLSDHSWSEWRRLEADTAQ